MDVVYEIPVSLSIDFDAINAEHEKLVSILNEALKIIRTEEDRSVGAVEKSLAALSAAMQAHFNHEEREMASLGYSDLPQHKAQHARCVAKLDATCRSAADNRIMNKSLLDEVFDIILDDVIRADSGFKSFLYARGILL